MNSRVYVLPMLVLSLVATGCTDATNSSASNSTTSTMEVAFNVAGAPTVEFNVPDMMCPEGCGAKTQEILSEQLGAKEVVINFDAKTATVAVEKDKFDANAAIAALVDYGFENSTLKASTSESDEAAPADQPAN